jgi:hypothetical protein
MDGHEFDTAKHHRSVESDFLCSLVYNGVQVPIDGVAQLVNRAAGTKLVDINLMDAPEPAEVGSARWQAIHLGAILGTLPTVAVVHKTVGLALGDAAGAGLGKKVLHAGMTGAVWRGVLEPVANDENFWQNRTKNAAYAGAFLSGFALGAHAMNKVAPHMAEGFFQRAFSNPDIFNSNIRWGAAVLRSYRFDDLIKEDVNK